MNLKKDYIQQLVKKFPELESHGLDNLVSENLISPFTVRLPSSVLLQAQESVSALYKLRQSPQYLEHYQNLIQEKGLIDPGNKSIMMSYDFHLNSENDLKLIEVNTNAAFLVLGHQMYQMKGHTLPVPDFSLEEIGSMIKDELRLQQKNPDSIKISITDEAPAEQRMYLEFLVYRSLFKSFGWDARIEDYRDLFKNFDPDFIYNRYTDFFLTDPTSSELRKRFLNREVCLSPNPFEYLMLADKQRMIDWRTPGFLESKGLSEEEISLILRVVPTAQDLNRDNKDAVWSLRRQLFFKPKNAFGSKQSYRGSTISRKHFEDIIDQDTIAQEYIPAPEVTFETPEGPQKFKFDLRCYAYQDRLQLVLARIYQGQVTNLRTTYGGFATVIFE